MAEQYLSKYQQLKSITPRGVARGLALSALSSGYKLSGKFPRLLRQNRVQILYLHHVFEDEGESFRRILDALSKEHVFISYSEAVERITHGNIDRPYVALSFDDGLKNNLRAAEVMREFGVTGCFFICPSIIGETNYQKIAEFCSDKLSMGPTEFLSWDDVETLLRNGNEIGSHSMTHTQLIDLPTDGIQEEVLKSKEVLTHRIGPVKHFAWPFGRYAEFGAVAARIVSDAGYSSCASAVRGCHIGQEKIDPADLCLRRDHVVADWPLSHVKYFMAKNVQTASVLNDRWPLDWRDTIEASR